jgi:hypothetical protein
MAAALRPADTTYGRFDPAKDTALLGWWSFDEGSGTLAADGSGNGNDGTVNGGATWVAGVYGSALQFNGQDAYVGTGKSLLNGLTGFTMAGWVSAGNTGVYSSLFGQNDLVEFGFTTENGGQVGTWMAGNGWAFIGANYGFPYPSWHHLALAGDATRIAIYIDGQEQASDEGGMTSGTSSYFFSIAGNVFNATGDWFRGEIDDVWLFSRALTEAEIQALMKGPGGPGLARAPRPADEATDVPRDVVLSWTTGEFAALHDVYFGTAFDDVNDAGRDNPTGVLLSQGQAAAAFDPPGVLDFAQTYYWRIDEVNAHPTAPSSRATSGVSRPSPLPIRSRTSSRRRTAFPTKGPDHRTPSTAPGSAPTTGTPSTPTTCGWPIRSEKNPCGFSSSSNGSSRCTNCTSGTTTFSSRGFWDSASRASRSNTPPTAPTGRRSATTSSLRQRPERITSATR